MRLGSLLQQAGKVLHLLWRQTGGWPSGDFPTQPLCPSLSSLLHPLADGPFRHSQGLREAQPELGMVGSMQLLVHEVLQEHLPDGNVRAAAMDGGNEAGKRIHLGEVLHCVMGQRLAREGAFRPGPVVGVRQEAVLRQDFAEANGQFHGWRSFGLGD